MKGYGQFCPVAKAAELFCEKWTPLIVRDLAWGASRFSELQRGVPLMSPTLLSRRLKQLEAEGVVERKRAGNARTFTYQLTRAGREFIPVIDALGVWGQRWSRRELAEGEIDLGLLMWALERQVDARAFGTGRTVVRLILSEVPKTFGVRFVTTSANSLFGSSSTTSMMLCGLWLNRRATSRSSWLAGTSNA